MLHPVHECILRSSSTTGRLGRHACLSCIQLQAILSEGAVDSDRTRKQVGGYQRLGGWWNVMVSWAQGLL